MAQATITSACRSRCVESSTRLCDAIQWTLGLQSVKRLQQIGSCSLERAGYLDATDHSEALGDNQEALSGCMFRLLQVQVQGDTESSSVTIPKGCCTNASSGMRLQCSQKSVQWHCIAEGQENIWLQKQMMLVTVEITRGYRQEMRIHFRANRGKSNKLAPINK